MHRSHVMIVEENVKLFGEWFVTKNGVATFKHRILIVHWLETLKPVDVFYFFAKSRMLVIDWWHVNLSILIALDIDVLWGGEKEDHGSLTC